MPLRAGIMPFGKNKKLTMPRAQKTKVPAREDAWEDENETGFTGAEEPAPPRHPLTLLPLRRQDGQRGSWPRTSATSSASRTWLGRRWTGKPRRS